MQVDPAFETGQGTNTFTSGFDGPWTLTPNEWNQEYFKNLLEYRWQAGDSPGGAPGGQFFPFNFTTGEPGPPIVMLVSDIAFIEDPDFRAIVEEFADPANLDTLNAEFARTWYQLATQDMGPVSRCTGPNVPEAQAFQDPLPTVSVTSGDQSAVIAAVEALVSDAQSRFLISNLAFQCTQTFRSTDWFGGCNGARIRFPPQV